MMNKETKNLFERYKTIVENSDISNNMSGSDVSTKYQTDNMSRFLPIGQDADDEERQLESEKLRVKLKELFNIMKGLIDACTKDTCTYKEISRLMDLMNSPEANKDMEAYKNALQGENQESGANASLSY
jgi:hypothetical protein